METYLEADIPEELCRHVFLSFVKKPAPPGSAAGKDCHVAAAMASQTLCAPITHVERAELHVERAERHHGLADKLHGLTEKLHGLGHLGLDRGHARHDSNDSGGRRSRAGRAGCRRCHRQR